MAGRQRKKNKEGRHIMSKLITAGQRNGSNPVANRKLKSLLATTAMTAAGILVLGASPARAVDDMATPVGEQVVGGSASFARPETGLLNVMQDSQRVVINWDSFNIGAKAKTEFFQPNSSSLAVNRVTGANTDPTMILGALKANGRLMVLDRNGVFFGAGAQIDVGGIIASTGDVDTGAIMNGADRFEISNFGGGSVVNYGTINVADAGLAAFVSPSVANYGVINAKLGKVAFGSGSKVTLDLYGDQLLEIALDDKHADALIEQAGEINAEGGTVLLTAQAAKEAVDNVINMSGVVNVSSVTQKGGKIVLNGGETGAVNVSGTLNAAGDGGFVETSGAGVNVTNDASITADMWLIDPLTIRISNTANSNYQTISASVLATSLNTGSVTLQTGVNSSFTAGKDNNGDILIDDTINKTGAANTTLSLIATRDILFTGGSGINSSGGALNLAFTAGRDIDLNRTITNRGNVTMTADGDVFLNSSMNTTGGNVSFNADDDIFINATLNAGAGSVNLLANGSGSGANDVTVNADILSSNNSISIKSQNDDVTINNDVTSGGGAINVFAGGDLAIDSNNAASDGVDDLIDAGAGNVNINADSLAIGTKGSVKGANVGISRADSTGRISIGAANGGLEVSQTELGRITANQLTFGTLGFGGFDNDIMVDGVNFSAFNKVVLNTMRNDSSSSQDVVFRNANTSKALEVFADDDVIFDFYNDYGGDHAATLTASGNVDFHGNTNGLSAGDLHLEQKSKIDTNGFNLTSEALNTVLDDKAVIDAEGGNISLFNNETFFSDDKDSVRTAGVGKIDIWQNVPGSIQNAIDAVQNTGSGRNTIHVGAGTYEENVLVYENNFYLMGANAGVDPNTGVRGAESIIDGGMGLDGHAFAVKNTGDNFTIDGFTLTADGNGVDLDGTDGSISNSVVRNNIITTLNLVDSDDEGIEGTNVNGGLIENNKLNVVGNDGMKFTGGSNITIQNNTITGTDFKGLNLNNIAGLNVSGNAVNNTGDDGVSVANSSGVSIANNLIGTTGGTNNIHGDGISVIDSAGTAISGNQVANTTGNGIFVDPSPNTVITYNTVSNAALNGIYVVNSDNVQVGVPYGVGIVPGNQGEGGNFVSNSGLNGIEVDGGTNVMIGNNTVAGAQTNGIYVHDADGVTVSTNEVYDVAAGEGIDVRNITTSANIHYNLIHDVSGDGIFAKDVAGLHVTSNGVGYTDIFFASTKDSAGSIGGDGIEVQDSDGAYVDYNMVAYAVGNGIYNNSSDGSTIAHNTVDNVGGHGVKVNPSLGVTVSYNTITDAADDGVNVLNSDFATVIWNTINSSGNNGVEINNGDYASVWNNTINGTDATYDSNGIFFIDSDNGSVRYNTVNNVYWDGIKIWNGDNTEVVSNTVNDARLAGISLFLSDSNLISGNTLNSSGGSGIHSDTNTNTTITGNTINGTDAYYGILHMNGSNSSITYNAVNNAAMDGIVLWNQTGTNTVSGNTVFSAGSPGSYNGIMVGLTNDAVISGNVVDDSGWDGINVQNSNGVQVTGNTITDTFGASGIAILNSLNNYVGGNWINNSGRLGIYALNADGLGVYGNTVLNSGLEAGLAWSGIHVESTDGANVSYNYVDGADLDGINIGDNVNTADGTSSNVTVDGNVVLNVARDGIHGTAGILSASGNTVNNTGDDGIEVSNSTGVVVNYNAIGTLGGANNIGGDGIQVNNSSYADIMGNVVTQTVGNGIFVDPSDYVEIAYNKILGVGGDGINLLDGVEGAIYSNDINGTGDSGVEAANNYGVDVYDNTVQNTDGDGIEVSNSAYAAVTGNSIYYAGDDGVDIDGSYEAAVGGNYIWDPVANGVEVSNSNGADIYGNGVYYAADGVNVAYSDYAWVNGNYIYGSGDDGVDLAYSGSSDISGNSIYYSGDNGVKVTDSNWVDVSGNYVYSTGGNGVYIDPSSYINVNGNTIYYTGDDGILVDGGYWASIYDNYIYSADGNGIRVLNNGYVNVDNNSVSYVDYDGIHVENFGYASVTDNSVYHTGDDGIETVNGDSVFIDYNTVQNAGYGDSYYYGYADYYGADGIHVRNVGSGYYGYYGDFVVKVTNNNVDTTADDGIEVVGSGRTLIGWNHVSNAGAGFDGYNDYYGWDGADGYGNDGIHVRNTYAYGGYYGEGYYGGYYSGYDVEILGNNVHVTADDGIEVVNSGSTLIQGNEVDHAGFVTNYYGYYGDYGYYGYYGYYSQIEESFGGDYYGADGIHVRNVHGESYGPGYYGYYGFQPYAVVINDNNVDTSADDGIEVVDSGRTLINWNTVNNSGVGNGYYGYYGYGEAPDGWGGDGIHVRNTYADGYLYDESYYGGYDVEVSDNEVTNSADDGIEVTYNDYYGEYDISSLDWYPGSTSTVGVLRNTVDNSGDDGIDITNANFVLVDSNAVTNSGFGDYNYDGDGITVNRHGSDSRRYKYDSFYGYGWFPNDVVITNNTVDDSADDGIEVNGYGQIEIGNNLVTDSGDDGVIVTNLLFDSWYNEVPQEEVSLFLLPAFGGANVNIHDNVVERSGSDGIEVDSFFDVFFDYFGFGPSNVNIENNDVTDSGENGLFVAGPSHGNVRVSGNTFTNFVNGAHFQSGRIDLTGDTNTFNNGSTGMLFAPYPFWYSESEGPSGYAPLDIVDDTIGTTVFNGQSDFYVYLDDSAEWAPGFPTVIDGTDATYDGIHPTETGNVLTLGQYNQIEAMIHDFMDEDFRGLFFFGTTGADIDEKDFFRTFDPFNAGGPGLNVTITGLPIVPGNLGQFLAGISPAAGGEGEQEEGGNAADLAGIEPAAGGGEDESCWSDAVNAALNGATASYTYDGTVDGLLADQAGCQNGEI